ncbi:hypothetical protein OSTOST_26020, partial [Ostertagia ostertagi]
AEGLPLISGVTSDGAPLFQGILNCPESRQTTTIITTTTTTYRMVEVSDSDSMSDDFELVDSSSLTVDVPLVTSRTPSPSQYMIVGKTESAAPLSPVLRSTVNIDLELPPSRIERAKELDEKPIMEEVSVYHSGVSSDHEGTQSTAEIEKVESPEIYTQEDVTSTSDKDYGINIRSSSDLKTISTSSDDEDFFNWNRDGSYSEQSPESLEKATVTTKDAPLKEAYYSYPSTSAYNGPLESTSRTEDIYGEPLTHHVSVYHSGRSDEPAPKPEEEHVDIADAAKAFGEKVTGLFRRGPAHLDYPVSETYEGPLDSTPRTDDIYGEPLTHHVSVYHSGRSDEPAPKPEEEHVDIADAAKAFGEKITGLFKRRPTIPDYPTSEPYVGPLVDTSRREDIESQPLRTVVTVYHSGRSDVPLEKAAVITEEVPPAGTMYYDYPTTAAYEGPLDSTPRTDDIYGEPLTHHVSVYHSGRSDEPAPKPEEEHVDIADAAKAFGEKITGLFKRRPTIPDYPTSEPYVGPLVDTSRREDIESQPLRTVVTVYHSGRSDVPLEKAAVITEEVPPARDMYYDYPTTAAYEGPLDSTPRTDDIYGEPLTHHVSVYHSGRSDEPAPKPEEEHVDIADAAKAFGEKVTGLFRRGPAHLDYPVSETYEGPLDSTPRLMTSMPAPKPEEEHVDIADAAKAFGEKITGLFKRRPTIPDYPTSEPYVGPLVDTSRREDIESQPLRTVVTVYHSGRSDVPLEKAAVITEEVPPARDMYYDYPTTAAYEGPLDSTPRTDDIYGEPLTHHVSVYHSGRSDEPAPKPEEEHVDIADAAKAFGEKVTGLFRRGPAHLDYPVSETYEGPLDSTPRTDDIYGEPLTHHVSVYHSGRSDEPAPKPEEEHVDIADAAKAFGEKITGLFKRRPTIPDYPTSEPYVGPLVDTSRREDIESQPLRTVVTVYHSGRSDVPLEKAAVITEEVPPARDMYYDYPTTAAYEGPLDSTPRTDDIYGEPLTHHVSVYHSGRSDEPAPKPEEEHVDIADAAKAFGEKVTGLFRRGPAHLDYPVSETYEGPLDSTPRTDDIYGEPLTHHVSVYHSGRSDEPAPKPEEEHVDIADAAKAFGEKITGLFKRRPTIPDYPTSEPYVGPLVDTSRREDIESQPLRTVVTVYHSGRSDVPLEKAAPAPKPEEEHVDIADAAKAFGEKVTGLFRRGPAHLDYPVSETYEGPLDSTPRTDDIYGEPLTHHVSVYHSGRSDEPAPKPEEEHVDIADAAKAFGEKITGLFKRRPTIPDYPTSEPYVGPLVDTSRREDIESQPLRTVVTVYHSGRSDVPLEKAAVITEEVPPARDMYYDYPTTAAYEGPLDSTPRTDDIYGEPLTHHVSVYHSGRSDEPAPKPEEEHVDIADAAKAFGEKSPRHTKDHLDSTPRTDDIYGEPLTHHVSVYHSGRSDEPAPKPEEEHVDIADAAKAFGEKITGLFKRRPTIPDYPTSEPYVGPLVDTSRREDIESQPLRTVVTVYHSGRSDVPLEKAAVITEEVPPARDMYYDYPTTAAYEGPLDSTPRTDDIYGEPLTHHVSVYHSGRSDEPAPKPEEEHVDIADAAKAFGEKVTGLFRRGPAHLDYPVSETYEGPLDSTPRTDDIYGEPLTHHVSVYHSGRSDEPAPKPEEEHVDIADAAKAFGEKITGLFKRRPTIPDYPTSEPYVGPLADTTRREDIESHPLRTVVTVYHSGRSDVPLEKAAVITEEVPPAKDMYYDYPTTAVYEGPLDSTPRTDDIYGEPLTHYVTVYHSGRSDEPTPKPEEEHVDIADAAKAFGEKVTGLFRRGPAHLDYPVSETYEGPLDSTRRTDDIYGEPLTHHVSVYHSGRSDEPAPKPEEHVDIADAAKAFGEKVTGLFRRGPAHLDYPVSETYEGPLDSTRRTDDIYGEPLTHHVSVYHSGRSDEPAPKPEEEHVDIADAAKAFGEKVTGLFRRGPAHLDYPVSETYEGPLDSTRRTDDIYGEPLTHHVSVYHSGRSDEPAPKTEEEHVSVIDKALGEETSTILRNGSARGYTVSEPREEPFGKGFRTWEMNGGAFKQHVEPRREPARIIGDEKWYDVEKDRHIDTAYEEVRNKIDLDVFFNVKSQEEKESPEDAFKESQEEELVFLSADKLERDQQPVGFSVSISARQPVDRKSSELFSSPLRESSSDTRYLREHSLRSERGRRHRLSPHTWTTVRERTEVTYVRKVRVERSLSPQTPARSHFIKRVPYKTSAETRDNAYSCRSSNFDERVMVHHPIYPPNESLYRNGVYDAEMRNGHSRTYSPVREVAAFDRTEWIDQHPSYIPPNRRSDEIFTVGTPFIMGHVERDGNGCAYLRYQSSGLQERPPLPERIDDLPMIEEGAIECRRATVRAGLRDMDTVGLVQDEEELERRRRPIRRARQRMRNYCTML